MKRFTALKCILLVVSMLCFLYDGIGKDLLSEMATKGMKMPLLFPPDSSQKPSKEKAPTLYSSPKNSKGKNGKITFETFQQNLSKAKKFYERKQFLSAAKYFEELYPLSMGLPVADTILFMFADCYFQNKDYQMAAFHFKDYARRYPGTERAELANLKCVQSIYNLSPEYVLDQYETKYAIDEINLFIQLYPTSKYMEECNVMLDNLRDKLARKDFEMLKLYYNTENYKATQIASKNFQKEFPYSSYSAEALYILAKNNYEYAKKSVESKKRERFMDCIAAYEKLKIHYPNSTFETNAKKVADEAQKQIDKLKEKKQNNLKKT